MRREQFETEFADVRVVFWFGHGRSPITCIGFTNAVVLWLNDTRLQSASHSLASCRAEDMFRRTFLTGQLRMIAPRFVPVNEICVR
jgi:hypothetical protein